jgi:hypothetical protein
MNHSLINAAQSLLDDAEGYLERISTTCYCQPLPKLSGSSVGQHTRHFVEFFQCLAEHLENAGAGEECHLNYDHRRRDHRIETEPRFALSLVESLKLQLPGLPWDVNLRVEHTDYLLGKSTLISSSAERELLYNIEHTIHHFALIKIGLNIVEPGLELPPHFGVAASTLQYRTVARISKSGHN